VKATKPKRPALRYYGGKWRIAEWIISNFPAHTCYVEPFGGGASVLLSKEPSKIEVYNDLDGEVVNFFRVLRERPEELIRAIQLTPYSREEYKNSYRPAENDLERARHLYIRSRQGRGGCTRQFSSGWRFERSDNRGGRTVVEEWSDTSHLEAVVNRLLQVHIENDDALSVIERYDTPKTLFYLDPPYLKSTRYETARWEYAHEMKDEDHRHLAQVLSGIQGMAIVSGYPSDLYAEIFSGWRIVECSARTDTAKEATECLWISPAADERLGDLRLFPREVSA